MIRASESSHQEALKMYSWGDDTATWNNPGKYDYGSAKKPYLDDLAKDAASKGPRDYSSKRMPKLDLINPKGKTIVSESENVVIIGIDGTGSMQHWPAEIFDRLPLLYQTLSKYRDDVEISFSVIGDAISDQWPTQISAFGKGVTLDDYLKALCAEGGGGGGMHESYELFAYFMQNHCKTLKAKSPTMIIMGDEMFYDKINPKQVKHYLGDALQEPLDARMVWQDLSNRFDIYLLRKSYPNHDKEIEDQWSEAIGKQKIIPLYDPTRVVDVALGIIAKKWGHFDDFGKNLSARQDDKNKELVMASLRAASIIDPDLKSKVLGAVSGKKSKTLAGGSK